MSVKVKILELTVLIVLLSSKFSQSHKCHKREQKDGGCPFQSYWSEHHWCEVHTYEESEFSFYIKPGFSFIELSINITRAHSLVGNVPETRQELKVPRKLVPDTNKWYKIDLKTEKSVKDSKETTDIFIDDYKKQSYDVPLTTDFKFILMLNGSLYFRPTNSCNPAEFPVKEEGAAEPPPHSPLPPHPVTTAPPGHFGSTTKRPQLIHGMKETAEPPPQSVITTTLGYSRTTDENERDDPVTEKRWWIFIIIGAAILIVTAVISVAIVTTKRRKAKMNDDTRESVSEKGPNNTTCDDQEEANPQGPPPTGLFNDPANHVLEEPRDDQSEEHLYEEMEDLQSPFASGNANVGQSVHSPGMIPNRHENYGEVEHSWHTRRGSAHDSENSLYGCL